VDGVDLDWIGTAWENAMWSVRAALYSPVVQVSALIAVGVVALVVCVLVFRSRRRAR
jgi:hypothetical protein